MFIRKDGDGWDELLNRRAEEEASGEEPSTYFICPIVPKPLRFSAYAAEVAQTGECIAFVTPEENDAACRMLRELSRQQPTQEYQLKRYVRVEGNELGEAVVRAAQKVLKDIL